MKKLIIIGTGGFAAEAYDYISTCESVEINFLDSIDIDEIREVVVVLPCDPATTIFFIKETI